MDATDEIQRRTRREALRTLQLVSCLALVPQLPTLAEWLAPVADAWRQAPDPAGP